MKKKEIVRRVMEKLGKKEKERRRKKKVMGFDSEEHIKDDHLAALSRGAVKRVGSSKGRKVLNRVTENLVGVRARKALGSCVKRIVGMKRPIM